MGGVLLRNSRLVDMLSLQEEMPQKSGVLSLSLLLRLLILIKVLGQGKLCLVSVLVCGDDAGPQFSDKAICPHPYL